MKQRSEAAQGKVKVNDTIELPEQKLQRKVKSLQVFRQSVSSCQQVGTSCFYLLPVVTEVACRCGPASMSGSFCPGHAPTKVADWCPPGCMACQCCCHH